MQSQTTVIPRHILSKSTFMYGCQCPKRLWLHKFQPELRDEMDEQQASIFQRGTDVGMLARQLFPDGVDASPVTAYEYQQSVIDTARYMAEGHKVIYEAAFQFEGILCAVDILVKKNGRWYAYEVKSSTSVKEPFIQDAALQYYVITHAGIALQDIAIVHLDNTYIRKGALDISKLFAIESVKDDVLNLQDFILEKIIALKQVLTLHAAPVMNIGAHCSKPYDCDFFGHCSKDEPEIDPEEKYINQEALNEFLEQLGYPLCFMDFETWMAAVPECDGHWPYRQVPFQFSVHHIAEPGANPVHHNYLASHPHVPLEEFLKQLLNAAGTEGTILVYNVGFEKTILTHLARQFPKYKRRIVALQDRMVDLMSPFRKNYRLPEMQWSYSIKYVLPALVPELKYDGLSIADGATASNRFYELQHETDVEKISSTREALLEYCGLDTMAMVRILEKLRDTMR